MIRTGKSSIQPQRVLGRINRNLEGIPTATFWELDFSGDTRSVVPYTLDDGTPIFLRVPDEWWANYTVTALGNDRTDADIKKLQYVGNVHTYDEVVGQVRDVAQLKYTQEWSYMQAVGEPAGPHTPGDKWTTLDYDDSPARWVVTYQETPDPNWPVGELTSYEQYSIRDGREYNSINLSYVDDIYTGSLLIEALPFLSTLSSSAVLSGGGGGGYFENLLLSEGLQSLFTTEDNSVKVAWDRSDWDLGDAGTVLSYYGIGLMDGLLIYEDKVGDSTSYYLTLDSESLDWTMPIDPGGIAVFTGNNWGFDVDANGNPVFGQADVGNDKLAVSQNGVTLTQINDSQRYIPSQGRVRTWQVISIMSRRFNTHGVKLMIKHIGPAYWGMDGTPQLSVVHKRMN